MGTRWRRFIVVVTSLNLIGMGGMITAHAGVIDTATILQLEERATLIERIDRRMSEGVVAEQLERLGVSPADIQVRLAGLSDEELVMMEQRLDALPAGGDSLLAIIGIAFVVLLILELVGVIDIFKKV